MVRLGPLLAAAVLAASAVARRGRHPVQGRPGGPPLHRRSPVRGPGPTGAVHRHEGRAAGSDAVDAAVPAARGSHSGRGGLRRARGAGPQLRVRPRRHRQPHRDPHPRRGIGSQADRRHHDPPAPHSRPALRAPPRGPSRRRPRRVRRRRRSRPRRRPTRETTAKRPRKRRRSRRPVPGATCSRRRRSRCSRPRPSLRARRCSCRSRAEVAPPPPSPRRRPSRSRPGPRAAARLR